MSRASNRGLLVGKERATLRRHRFSVFSGRSPSVAEPRLGAIEFAHPTRCGVRTHAIKLSGATARDRGIAAELDRYIDRNYGNAERAVPPTSEHLPSRQRRALGELTENVSE